MDTKILVEDKYEAGKKLIEALDKRKIHYPIYLWAKFPEKEDWILLIGIPDVGKIGGKNIFFDLRKIIKEENIDLSLNNISLLDSKSGLLFDLRRTVKQPGIGKMNFVGNIINNKRFPDSIIYRVE